MPAAPDLTPQMAAILRWMADNANNAHTPNRIGLAVGVAPRGGAQYRSRGPGSIISPCLTSLRRRGYIDFGPRPDGMSGTAYRITDAGLEAARRL